MIMLVLSTGMIYAQAEIDTITETFNGICEQTTSPGRTYNLSYAGEGGIEWSIKTLYSSSSWWGGIDDGGNEVLGTIHCGSLQWENETGGFAMATIRQGISTLSFQMRYGYQLVGGYVRVLVNGFEIGRTDSLTDKDIHAFTFDIHTGGPLKLELIPVVESTKAGGIIVDNLTIITSDLSIPFFNVEMLDEYEPWMDTLKSTMDTIELYMYAEHCLEMNGEFVDYFETTDDVELTVGSVIDLIPGDSTNIYYWGSAVPGIGSTGGEVPVSLFLSVNTGSDTIGFETTDGEDVQEGTLSFMNDNVDYDLVIFGMKDLKHEYRFRFTYDSHEVSDTTTTSTGERPGERPGESSVRFYPNPVQNHAWFETGKDIKYYEIFDMNGRRLHLEGYPQLTGDGYYKLDLNLLETGIWVIRFRYTDNTSDAVRILVE